MNNTTNLMYPRGIKQQVIDALRKVFQDPNFPDKQMANRIKIELQYPIIQESYPAIYVNYVDEFVRDSGLGNYYIDYTENGTPVVARQWFFQGSIGLNIMALDPVERDTLAGVIAGMLAFSKDNSVYKKFRTYVTSEEFVSLQPQFAILGNGAETTRSAPWENSDEFVYMKQYTLKVLGCFFTDPDNDGGEMVQLSKIRTYPYRSDQATPTGSSTQPVLIDWSS